MQTERRQHRRVKAKNVAGHVRVKDEVLALGLPIDNISLGGLFVRTDSPLPVGTKVALELSQPKLGGSLKVAGTTVLSLNAAQAKSAGSVAGMGVRFDPLPAEATEKLRALLSTLSEDGKAQVVGAHNPAEIDATVEQSRRAFDFSFVSLDAYSDDDAPAFFAPPAAVIATPPPVQNAVPQDGAPAQTMIFGGTPAPVVVTPPPAPPAQAIATPPPPAPAPVIAPPPPPASPQREFGSAPVQVPESAKLMVQVRGLLLDLDETRAELERRADEMSRLQDANVQLKAELARRDQRISELERRLAQR